MNKYLGLKQIIKIVTSTTVIFSRVFFKISLHSALENLGKKIQSVPQYKLS